jgi:hypothetical protein
MPANGAALRKLSRLSWTVIWSWSSGERRTGGKKNAPVDATFEF